MMNRREQREAASRFEDRRRREDNAPRLREEIPELQVLRLELEEYRQGGTTPLFRHTRHIVVERAPALFVISCSDDGCVDGGHDLTRPLMRKLEAEAERFEGEHECWGRRNGLPCRHSLRFQAHASYID